MSEFSIRDEIFARALQGWVGGFSTTQRLCLVYAPKVSALMSVMGSCWIVFDLVHRTRANKAGENQDGPARSLRNNVTRRGSIQQRLPGLESTYPRILLLMSLIDMMTSSWYFVGTWAASGVPPPGKPALHEGTARGNQATCSAQGFFLQLGIAVPLYNVSQAIYSLLLVKYNYKEFQIANSWIYYALIGLPSFFGLATAITGLPLNSTILIQAFSSVG